MTTEIQKARVQELRNMIEQIPACNIADNLSTWVTPDDDRQGTCGTLACLAGWAAHHKPFVDEGFKVSTNHTGYRHPIFTGYRGFDACYQFFGSEELFKPRSNSAYDHAIFEERGEDITDHELCIYRIDKHLEELG